MSRYLFLDIETTGLPEFKSTRGFYSYTRSEYYSTSRVVQVAWLLCDPSLEPIHELTSRIISPSGFSIENSSIHGITNEIANAKGIQFRDFAAEFAWVLEELGDDGVIIAHNAEFDVSVLAAELHLQCNVDTAAALVERESFCTMINTTNIIRLPGKLSKWKYPSLAELYAFACNKKMKVQHDAAEDVRMLHMATKALVSNKLLTL